eukprot:scpid49482/ scgid18899/ 
MPSSCLSVVLNALLCCHYCHGCLSVLAVHSYSVHGIIPWFVTAHKTYTPTRMSFLGLPLHVTCTYTHNVICLAQSPGAPMVHGAWCIPGDFYSVPVTRVE